MNPFITPTRSQEIKVGRPKVDTANYYTIPGVFSTDQAPSTISANTDYYAPWYTPTPIGINELAFELTTGSGSGNIRIGVYAANDNWQPVGNPLLDSGDIPVQTTGIKTYNPGFIVFPPGRYVSVLNCSASVALMLRTASPSQNPVESGQFLVNFSVGRTYAAFPTPGTAWTSAAGSSTPGYHYIVYQVSAA